MRIVSKDTVKLGRKAPGTDLSPFIARGVLNALTPLDL
jgi:hypothetical protein